jgi:hypothetical protein
MSILFNVGIIIIILIGNFNCLAILKENVSKPLTDNSNKDII